MTSRLLNSIALAAALTVSSGASSAQADQRWIVNTDPSLSGAELIEGLQTRLGVTVSESRAMVQPGSWLLKFTDEKGLTALRGLTEVSAMIKGLPGVRFASPDLLLQNTSTSQPTDPVYAAAQASYLGSESYAGMNMGAFWSRTRGSSQKVIAVMDSGVLYDHPDLGGRLLPGYDFVSDASPPPGTSDPGGDFFGSNDGDGRDSDPSDPGDAPPVGTVCPLTGQTTSSFHGTSVSSVAAAQSDNGQFVTGMDWNAKILPVRVSGRCGTALTSDIVDAIYWAIQSGRQDPLLPANPFRPDVINLSFAAQETLIQSCGSDIGRSLALAISDSVDAGVPVIISAGNNGGSLGYPASCAKAIAVGAVTSDGVIASYSSRGQRENAITIFAPGDQTATYAAANNRGLPSGAPDPAGHNAVGIQGTSFAAPVVSGLVASLKAVRADLGFDELVALMGETALLIPGSVPCSSQPAEGGGLLSGLGLGGGLLSPLLGSGCNAGIVAPVPMLEALAAGRPLANIPQSRAVFRDSIVLDGSLSKDSEGGASLLSYRWVQTGGVPVSLGGTDSPSLTVRSGLLGNTVELALRVMDSRTGDLSTAQMVLQGADPTQALSIEPLVTILEAPAPGQPEDPVAQPAGEGSGSAGNSGGGVTLDAQSGSGSGGGGALGLHGLALLAVGLAFRRRQTAASSI